jgi:acyl carrier protein
MSTSQQSAEQVVRGFVAEAKPEVAGFGPQMPLHAEGVGLDSLQVAELSAILEDAFGTDPYSAGLMPQTMAEIIGFYDQATTEA